MSAAFGDTPYSTTEQSKPPSWEKMKRKDYPVTKLTAIAAMTAALSNTYTIDSSFMENPYAFSAYTDSPTVGSRSSLSRKEQAKRKARNKAARKSRKQNRRG